VNLVLFNVQGRRRRTLAWILIAGAFTSSIVWWLLAVLGVWDAPIFLRMIVFFALGSTGLGLRWSDRGESDANDDQRSGGPAGSVTEG